MKKIKRIGIFTSGGDCSGLNAVINAVIKPPMPPMAIHIVSDGAPVDARFQVYTAPKTTKPSIASVLCFVP